MVRKKVFSLLAVLLSAFGISQMSPYAGSPGKFGPNAGVAGRRSVNGPISIVGTTDWNLAIVNSTTSDGFHVFPGSSASSTYQISSVAAADLYWIQPGFPGYMRDSVTPFWGEMPIYSPFRIKAELVRYDLASGYFFVTPMKFNGSQYGLVSASNGVTYTDPLYVHIPKGERYYIRYVLSQPLLGYVPPVPLVAPSDLGGYIHGGTYYVAITYVWPNGLESVAVSGRSGATITTTTGSISIFPPKNPNNGAIGFNVYCSSPNPPNGDASPKYLTLLGTQSFASGSSSIIQDQPNLSWAVRPTVNSSNAFYGFPMGAGLFGAANTTDNAVGGSNTGDWASPLTDSSGVNYNQSGSNWSTAYGPIVIFGGYAPNGPPSVAILGDSRIDGVGDIGLGYGMGGFAARAISGQTSTIAYNLGKVPLAGFAHLSSRGETAATFANPPYSYNRRQICAWAPNIVSNYSIVDLQQSIQMGPSNLVANLAQIAKWQFAAALTSSTSPIPTWTQCTLEPQTYSSDAFQTIGNQYCQWDNQLGSIYPEGYRRAVNNVLRNTGGALMITNEVPFSCLTSAYTTTVKPAINLYSGGDGVTKTFITAYPFLVGSESIKIAGKAHPRTQAYSYVDVATINGKKYAGAITFATAPGKLPITISYTSLPGFISVVKTAAGTGNVYVADVASAVEVDAAGKSTLNGGWWKPNQAASLTGKATGGSASSLVVAGTPWTRDQFRGQMVLNTSVAPPCVAMIQSNTSNTLNLLSVHSNPSPTLNTTFSQWSITNGQSFSIVKSYTWGDGSHPSPTGNLAEAQKISTANFVPSG